MAIPKCLTVAYKSPGDGQPLYRLESSDGRQYHALGNQYWLVAKNGTGHTLNARRNAKLMQSFATRSAPNRDHTRG